MVYSSEKRRSFHETEIFSELVHTQLAVVAEVLQPWLSDKSIHIGVVGPSNRGKTILTWQLSELCIQFGLPASYIDLDLWSPSGEALRGEVAWDRRRKRTANDVSSAEVVESITHFREQKGLVFGDFPGLVTEQTQRARLEAIDYAVLLSSNVPVDALEWTKLLTKSRLPFAWTITSPSTDEELVSLLSSHTLINLNRDTSAGHIGLAHSLTSLLKRLIRFDDQLDDTLAELMSTTFSPENKRILDLYDDQFSLVFDDSLVSIGIDFNRGIAVLDRVTLYGHPFLIALPMLYSHFIVGEAQRLKRGR